MARRGSTGRSGRRPRSRSRRSGPSRLRRDRRTPRGARGRADGRQEAARGLHRPRGRPTRGLGPRLRLRRSRREARGLRRHRLPGGLGLEALHRHRGDAPRGGRKARHRRAGHALPAGLPAPEPVSGQRAHHPAHAHVAPRGPHPRASRGQLLRDRRAHPRGHGGEPQRHHPRLSPQEEDQVQQRRDRHRGLRARGHPEGALRRPGSRRPCSCLWA